MCLIQLSKFNLLSCLLSTICLQHLLLKEIDIAIEQLSLCISMQERESISLFTGVKFWTGCKLNTDLSFPY